VAGAGWDDCVCGGRFPVYIVGELVWESCDGYVEETDVIVEFYFYGEFDCGGHVIEFVE
jgi:hypothetical protein